MNFKNKILKYLLIASMILTPITSKTIGETKLGDEKYAKTEYKDLQMPKEDEKSTFYFNAFDIGLGAINKAKKKKRLYLEKIVSPKDSLDQKDSFIEYENELKEVPANTKPPIYKKLHRDTCILISKWKEKMDKLLAKDDSIFNQYPMPDKINEKENKLEDISMFPQDVFEIWREKKQDPRWKNWNKKYYILSKSTNTLFVFDHFHNLIGQSPILRGKDVGDVFDGKKSITPSGKGTIFYAEKELDIYGSFTTPFYRIKYSNLQDSLTGFGLHGIPILEYKERIKKLKSPTPEDNFATKGCINCNRKWLLKHEPIPGDSIFVCNEPTNIDIGEILKIPEMKNIYMQFALDQYETSKAKYERKEKISFAYGQ